MLASQEELMISLYCWYWWQIKHRCDDESKYKIVWLNWVTVTKVLIYTFDSYVSYQTELLCDWLHVCVCIFENGFCYLKLILCSNDKPVRWWSLVTAVLLYHPLLISTSHIKTCLIQSIHGYIPYKSQWNLLKDPPN